VNSPHGHTCDEMKVLSRRRRSWRLHWRRLFLLLQPLRHLLHRLQRWKSLHLRRLLATDLPCPLLPQSKMLRWRRLRLLCSFQFFLLNVKSFCRVQPKNFSQRVLHLCKYISFS
jgi:hypothetical protein